jgi:hypothetical protein
MLGSCITYSSNTAVLHRLQPMQPTPRSGVELHVQREPTAANATRSNRRHTAPARRRTVTPSRRGRWERSPPGAGARGWRSVRLRLIGSFRPVLAAVSAPAAPSTGAGRGPTRTAQTKTRPPSSRGCRHTAARPSASLATRRCCARPRLGEADRRCVPQAVGPQSHRRCNPSNVCPIECHSGR